MAIRKLKMVRILALMGTIFLNEYFMHVRVSESQFPGLNVEILFSLVEGSYREKGWGIICKSDARE